MEYIYGALLLHKLGHQVSDESLTKVIAATGTHPDAAKVKTLIAALNGVDIAAELANAGSLSMGAPAASAAVEKKEEKKEEEKPSESAAGLASLFG